MQVRSDVQASAASLDQGHRACPRTESHGVARAPDQKGRDAALYDRQHFTERRGLDRRKDPPRTEPLTISLQNKPHSRRPDEFLVAFGPKATDILEQIVKRIEKEEGCASGESG